MKVTLELTEAIVQVDGRPARIWRGHTAAGTPCLFYVARVQVVAEHAAEFDAELRDAPPADPSPAVQHAVWERVHGPRPQ